MSFQSKFLKFMASPSGRKTTFYSAVFASFGATCVVFVPDTFLTTTFKDIVASYHQGVQRPLTQPIADRFEIAQEVLKLPVYERRLANAFFATGLDTLHIGSLRMKYGGNVGIPLNYTYTSPHDIDKSGLIARGNSVDWSSEGGKLLEEALVLKDDEQIFAIARELLYLKENNLILQSMYPAIGIFIYYLMTHNLNSQLLLFHRPLGLRIALYGICAFFAFGIYALAADYHQVQLDHKVDETLSNLGEKFIEAGIRFYDKLMKKNKAIRNLTGDESQYTASGNENYYIRNKTFPLFLRKEYFNMRKKEIAEQKLKKTENVIIEGSNDIQVQ